MSKVREALSGVADTVGRNKEGNLVARREFFYTHGYSAEKFSQAVSSALSAEGIKHTIVDSGETWKPFRGGASVANSSHWWVEIRLEQQIVKPELVIEIPEVGRVI